MASLKPIIRQLGVQPYHDVFQQMLAFQEQRTPDTADEMWILEHEPVFTLGRNGKPEHILTPSNIPVINIDRGGQVTYHGPGQLIIYTLIDLKRNKLGIREWVSHIENSIIRFLDKAGIEAVSDPKAPGVYVAGKKIAALGLRVSRGRCYHGLSFNIDMDLKPFSYINPCGYEGLEVTQCRDLGIEASVEEVGEALVELLGKL